MAHHHHVFGGYRGRTPWLNPDAIEVTEEMRATAFARANETLGKLDELRKRRELPVEMLPLVAMEYGAALQNADHGRGPEGRSRAARLRSSEAREAAAPRSARTRRPCAQPRAVRVTGQRRRGPYRRAVDCRRFASAAGRRVTSLQVQERRVASSRVDEQPGERRSACVIGASAGGRVPARDEVRIIEQRLALGRRRYPRSAITRSSRRSGIDSWRHVRFDGDRYVLDVRHVSDGDGYRDSVSRYIGPEPEGEDLRGEDGRRGRAVARIDISVRRARGPLRAIGRALAT